MSRKVKVRTTRTMVFREERTFEMPDNATESDISDLAYGEFAWNVDNGVIIHNEDHVEILEDVKVPKKENVNCLVGMKCPKCGHAESFRIAITSIFDVEDNGIENNGDTEWNDDSLCECKACGHAATVKDFRRSV